MTKIIICSSCAWIQQNYSYDLNSMKCLFGWKVSQSKRVVKPRHKDRTLGGVWGPHMRELALQPFCLVGSQKEAEKRGCGPHFFILFSHFFSSSSLSYFLSKSGTFEGILFSRLIKLVGQIRKQSSRGFDPYFLANKHPKDQIQNYLWIRTQFPICQTLKNQIGLYSQAKTLIF